METRLDQVIEELEQVNVRQNKINSELEILREDTERLEDKQPFMVRHIAQKKKKVMKLLKESSENMLKNNKLNEEYNKLKAIEDQKTKIEETPKKTDE